MTDSKSMDHWRFLAQQLGAAPASEPEEEAKTPDVEQTEQPTVVVNPAVEPPPVLAAEGEATRVSEPVTPSVPEPPPKPSTPPPPAAAKPKARNHWRELAAKLGLEVSEPEPEEPEVAEAVAPSDWAEPVAPAPVPPAVINTPEPRVREVDAGPKRAPDSRREGRRPSLFEDPDLSLDTPGVLDAVFDEAEPAATAEPEDIFEHRSAEPPERELESRDRFALLERDELSFGEAEAQDVDEAPVEAATGVAEAEEALDTEDEERANRRRRRPRRRRRGGRRDQEPAPDGGARGDAEAGRRSEEEPVEPRATAPVREIPEAEEVDEGREFEDEDEDEDHYEEEDEEEEGSGERLKLKHKKIPTWQQAIDAIISVNMEARAKNPGGGGGSRGRGRRWRK